MLQEIRDNPVIPLHWGKNQKGMQANEEWNAPVDVCHPDGYKPGTREEAWLAGCMDALNTAERFMAAGYHKQVVNRILEPYMHIDVLVTSTDWTNFLGLRDHPDAEPHIAILAREVKDALSDSKPYRLAEGQWHLPFADDVPDTAATVEYLMARGGKWESADIGRTLIKLSVARCARISYKPFDGKGDIPSEVARHDALVGSVPMHASPAEHQARPGDPILEEGCWNGFFSDASLHGNLYGWVQYRKTIPGENILA
jgi:hypothetical protein